MNTVKVLALFSYFVLVKLYNYLTNNFSVTHTHENKKMIQLKLKNYYLIEKTHFPCLEYYIIIRNIYL